MASKSILTSIGIVSLGFCLIYVFARLMTLQRRLTELESVVDELDPSSVQTKDASEINELIRTQLEEAINVALSEEEKRPPMETPPTASRQPPPSRPHNISSPFGRPQALHVPPFIAASFVTVAEVDEMDTTDISDRIQELPSEEKPTTKIELVAEQPQEPLEVQELLEVQEPQEQVEVQEPQEEPEQDSESSSKLETPPAEPKQKSGTEPLPGGEPTKSTRPVRRRTRNQTR